MEIKDAQKLVDETISKIDKKREINHRNNELELFVHLIEEVGELSRQILNPKIKRDETDLENVKEELSDILLFTLAIANKYLISLDKEFQKKITKLKERYEV